MTTSATPQGAPEPRSIEQIEADLAIQRAALAADLEALGAALAPQALKQQASRAAKDAAASAGHKVTDAAVDAKDRLLFALAATKDRAALAATEVREVIEDRLMTAAPDCTTRQGSCPVRHAPQALRGLLREAAAGQPKALALTGALAVTLVGVGAYAVVRATRTARA